jgi:transcription antitermination protein NusB
LGTRRQAREHALQVLYQIDMTGDPPEAAFELHWRESGAAPGTRTFAEQLVLGTVADAALIDDLIRESSENWRVERMPIVDRNVIPLAIHELLGRKDTPAPVVLNEAIELAKKFGGEGSAEFVNGVLDAVRKTIEARAGA